MRYSHFESRQLSPKKRNKVDSVDEYKYNKNSAGSFETGYTPTINQEPLDIHEEIPTSIQHYKTSKNGKKSKSSKLNSSKKGKKSKGSKSSGKGYLFLQPTVSPTISPFSSPTKSQTLPPTAISSVSPTVSTMTSSSVPSQAPTTSQRPSTSQSPSQSLAPSSFCENAPGNIVSTFDVDLDGWEITGNEERSQQIAFVETGGNPGGHVVSIENEEIQGLRYFEAPPKFRGDFSDSFGLFLRFDLRVVSEIDPSFENLRSGSPDVRMFTTVPAEEGGSDRLYMSLLNLDPGPISANGEWQSYAIALDDRTPWLKSRNPDETTPRTTNEEIRTILGELRGISIRAEYTRNEDEASSLDNVLLETLCGAVPVMII